MKRNSLKTQAMITTVCGALVRLMGFFLRLLLSRLLGAEALGVMELASGAHMLALTPAASGLPSAVSRLTARAETPEKRALILRLARKMALKTGLLLFPLMLLLSPFAARALGDERALPSLWLFSPCVIVVSVSSVYDGAFFGMGRALPPALSEMAEQLVRLGCVLCFAFLIPRLTPAYRAALPAFASTLGEAAGLLVIMSLMGRVKKPGMEASRDVKRQLIHLSLPLLCNRLVHTFLRSLCSAMVPSRLMAAGLSQSEAMSRLGMLGGMVMPLMFLPGLLSGALAAVGAPAAARCKSAEAERRLFFRLLLPSLAVGALCAAFLYLFAPWISMGVYRLPELTPLLRGACPLAVLLPVSQTVGGFMTGLGQQKRSLFAGLLGAAATLLCTYQWTRSLGIAGSACAQIAGHGLTLFCELAYLLLRLFKKGPAPCRCS